MKHFFPLKAPKFLKSKLIESKKMAEAIMILGPFSPLMKFWLENLFIYSLLYPLLRLSKTKEQAVDFCEKFIKMPNVSQPVALPKLMKNKIFLKSNQEWTAFIEINLRDTYCKNNIKPGMNVVDIGAHIGSYALMASEKTGAGGKIIAVEPEAENYKNLLENINLNNLENVIPVNIALSDRDGQEKLYINSQSTCHSLSPDNGQAAATAFVKTKTLDSLLKELKIEKIDIIKIDTEGWETHILKGALETLKNNPKAKLFIASYHYPGETEEVQNFLQKMGFNTKIRYADIIVTA